MSGHHVDTAKDMGWAGLTNGDLLYEAERNGYEIFLSADQSIRYQQNLTGRRIALLILLDNAWPKVRERTADIQRAIEDLELGDYRELEI